MNSDRVLVGTFVKKSYVPQRILKSIVENFNTNKIFIFSVEDETHQRLITFNVEKDFLDDRFTDYKDLNKNTLRLHRRKDSNTFYTINALNAVVEKQNGKQDTKFEVDWTELKNCCLLLDQDGNLKILKTKLAKVIDYDTVQ